MRKALNMDLVYCFFDAANMQRWNDHLRPIELTELDKQSHKVAIAWLLAKFEEDRAEVNWRNIIEYSMFSFIQRLILTDLKPQLFHRIKAEKAEEMNRFVLSRFDELVPHGDPGFRERFSAYLCGRRDSLEDQIVRAAHYLATYWEFRLIRDMNRSMNGIDQTERDIQSEIMVHSSLYGFREVFNKGSFGFLDLVGQLRFQQRWVRTPRLPRTTVLGHMLMVADMVYLNDLDRGADDGRIYDDYFKALFHDLPEVLTKDVISPVKENVHGLSGLLEEYEKELVESRIMPLLPEAWRPGFRKLIYDPFDGEDGDDIKTCDILAAYMEADVSLRYGVGSDELRRSREGLREKLASRKGIDCDALLRRFESMRV